MMSKGNQRLDWSVPEKTKDEFGWFGLGIMKRFPFSIEEDPLLRQYLQLSPIARNTFTKYIELLT